MAVCRSRPWALPAVLLALFVGCADGDVVRSSASDAAGAKGGAVVDAAPSRSTQVDAVAMSGAGGTRAVQAECVPGVQRVDVCQQPYPGCTTGGGYASATCRSDGTLGPCMCMPDTISLQPPDAAETAACLPVASEVFVDECASCVCAASKECAQGLAGCGDDCLQLTQCLGSCLPDGGAAIDCVVKCINAYSPETLAQFGLAVPNCVARCPDHCAIELLIIVPDPDADGGAP